MYGSVIKDLNADRSIPYVKFQYRSNYSTPKDETNWQNFYFSFYFIFQFRYEE